MSDNKYFAIVLTFFAAFVIIIVIAANEKADMRTDCKKKGGVLIETDDKFLCLKKDLFVQ